MFLIGPADSGFIYFTNFFVLYCLEETGTKSKIKTPEKAPPPSSTPMDCLLSAYKTKLALVQRKLSISYKNLLDLEKQRMVSNFTLCNKDRRVESLPIPLNSKEFSYL